MAAILEPDVIFTSYDVISLRCGPQSEQFWTYYLPSKFRCHSYNILGAKRWGPNQPPPGPRRPKKAWSEKGEMPEALQKLTSFLFCGSNLGRVFRSSMLFPMSAFISVYFLSPFPGRSIRGRPGQTPNFQKKKSYTNQLVNHWMTVFNCRKIYRVWKNARKTGKWNSILPNAMS